jgi:hypothetical protein
MPLLSTRGVASARGLGFGALTELGPIPDSALDISQFTYVDILELSPSFNNIYVDVGGSPNPYLMTVSDDGKYFYINDYGSNNVYQFTMATPFAISTATTSGFRSGNIGAGQSTGHMGMTWEPNGTFFIVGNYNTGPMVRYNVSSAWMVNTISSSLVGNNLNLSGNAYTRVVSRNGTRITTQDGNTNVTHQYNMNTAWNPGTFVNIARSTTTSPGTNDDMFQSIFSYEGQWFFVIDSQAKLLRQFASASAFNIPNGGTTNAIYTLNLGSAPYSSSPRLTEFAFAGGQRHLYVLQQRGSNANNRQIAHYAKLT